MLSDAVPVVAIDGFRGAQWTKLIVNMLNAVPAIVGESVQDVVADRRLRRVVAASMRETVRVGIARGIRFGSLQGLGDRRLRLFARLPLAIGQVLPWSMRVRMGDVPNLGSTQQSLRRGQPTEIDFLNGAVVREASAAGLDAPVSRALTALVHEVERRGEPLASRAGARRRAGLTESDVARIDARRPRNPGQRDDEGGPANRTPSRQPCCATRSCGAVARSRGTRCPRSR